LRVAAMRAISASPTLFCVNGTQNDVIASENLCLLPIRSDGACVFFTPRGGYKPGVVSPNTSVCVTVNPG
jgi:hypothetical protein